MKVLIVLSLAAWFCCCATPAPAQEVAALALPRAIAIALEQNPLLQAAGHAVEAAHAGVAHARASFLPRLDAQESWTRADNPVFAFSSKLNQGRFTPSDFDVRRLNHPAEINNFRTALSFAQPLYTGGKASLALAQAQLRREATVQDFTRRQQEVICHVAKAYYGILLAQEELAVMHAAVRAAEANRALARDRFATGLVVESDVLAAEVRLAHLTAEEITAQNCLRIAKATLNEAMGRPVEEPVVVTGQLGQRLAPQRSLIELTQTALAKRPDYRQLGLEVQALDRGVALAQAAFHPTVHATANVEVNRFNFAANGQDSWFVGIVAQWNLFDGLADRARVAEARAQLARFEALHARLANAIMLEVQEAFFQLQSAADRIGVAQRAVVQAAESLRIVTDRYQARLTTIVDFLGSEAA
ncbi:MAG: TolC family protein, partial [Thermodesulfobacteriota bacterium]